MVSARRWLEWARAYVRSLDSLLELSGMPAARDPDPEELRPYLKGWGQRGREEHICGE